MSNYTGIIEQERYTCAIGALQTVVAIPKAVPILHSGPGCGEMIAGCFERSTGYAGGSMSAALYGIQTAEAILEARKEN